MAAAKRIIRNPEAWVGRYVKHMANWREFEYTEKYSVCQITGILYHTSDDYAPSSAELPELIARGWEPAANYCQQGIRFLMQRKPDYSIRWIGLLV